MNYALLILMMILMLAAFWDIHKQMNKGQKAKHGFYICVTGVWLGLVEVGLFPDDASNHMTTGLLTSIFLLQMMWFYKNKVN